MKALRTTTLRALVVGGAMVVLALAGARELFPVATSTTELSAMCVSKSSGRVRYVASTAQCSTRTETPKSLPANAPLHLCAYPPDGFTRWVIDPSACVGGETPLTLPEPGPTFFCVNSSTGSFLQYAPVPASCAAMLAVVSVPVGELDVYSLNEDTFTAPNALAGVLANDTDAMSHPLTATLVPASGPANASAFSFNANGSFSYTPNANFCGVDTFSYTATDGTYTSQSTTAALNVLCVNDAPSFNAGPNQSVAQDSGAQTVAPWATNIFPGPPDEAGQTLTFNASNDNNGLFSSQPAVDSTGVLTYTPAAGQSGSAIVTLTLSDNGGTANGGVDTSAAQTFTITVTPAAPTNQAPTAVDDLYTPTEDTPFAQAAPGVLGNDTDPNVGDTLTAVLVTGPANAAPASFNLAADGSFTYTPAPNFCGSDSFTYNARDQLNATSATPATVTLNVTCVNDAPSFTKGGDQTVPEDAGAQTVAPWATAMSAGPPDEAGQMLSFNASNDNNGLFSSQPAVDSTGVLTYTPAANASGIAIVTLTLSDNGGTANGGVDTSAAQTFTITVTAANDPPSFTKGPDQTVNEDAGAQTVNPWATAISAGPNEAGQTLTFNVGNDNPALFSVQPAVSPTGVLTYTSAPNAFGSATVTISLSDNGGTANGGVDTSPAQTFTITVNPVNDAPQGVVDSNHAVTGNIQINVAAPGLRTGVTDIENDAMTAQVDGSSTHLGNITINADGSYSYNPKPGREGADAVKFKVCDNGSPTPACSTVQTLTLNVSGMIWFVDNSKVAAGDGRLTAPFNTLAGFQAANTNTGDNPAANDNIFLDRLVATDYTGFVTLHSGQKLFGKGATAPLTGAGSLTGLTLAPDSIAPPTTSGTAPRIVTIAANTNAVNLGQNNTIRGLSFGSTTGAAIAGTNFGTLTSTETAIGPARSGAALNLATGTANVTFSDVTSTSSAAAVTLTNIDGTLNLGSASSAISGYSANGFLVQTAGGSATINYPGTITGTNGTAVSVSGKDTGIVTFGGAISQTGGTGGINLSSNTGATITFSSTITLSGANATFVATGGGTVNAGDVDNVVGNTTAATGPGVRVENTTLGSTLRFKKVSVTGGTNGILLNNTGPSFGLAVSGTGTTDATGGTIQSSTAEGVFLKDTRFTSLKNMVIGDGGATAGQTPNATNNVAGDGIDMNNADDVTFDNLKIARTGGHGIDGTKVTNLILQNSEIINAGDADNEHAFAFNDFSGVTPTENNLEGTVTITNNVFDGFVQDGINVENFVGTLNMTVSGSTFANNTSTLCSGGTCGETGLLARSDGNSVINLTVNGNTLFNGIDGNGLFFISEGSSATASTLNVTNTTIQNSKAIGIVLFGGTGDHTSTIPSKLDFTIGGAAGTGVSVTGSKATAVSIQPNGKSTVRGKITHVTVNGSEIGRGIEVLADDVSTSVIAVNNNTVSNTAFNGIFANNQDTGKLDIHIRNNTVSAPLDTSPASGLAVHGIEVNPFEQSVNCLDIAGNSSAGNAASGGAGYRTRQRDTSTFSLERYTGPAFSTAQVQSFLVAQNTSGTASATVNTGGGSPGYTGVADGFCADPP